jgi:hypothetical protein
MGTLRKYDLSSCGCIYFFETGTGLGASLRHALHNGRLKKLFSTEIHEQTAIKAQALFQNKPAVEIINENSTIALKKILPLLDPYKPILFFLDAHFPGEVSENYSYDQNVHDDVTMPLKEELKIIKTLRPTSPDILIVDDLNLYEDGPFENGNIVKSYANIKNEERDLSFVSEIFGDKNISRDFRDEGYLILKPYGSTFCLRELPMLYRLKRSLIKNANKYLKIKLEER